MNSILNSFLGAAALLSLLMKVGLHIYLDKMHDRFEFWGPGGIQRIQFFFPYMQDVDPRYQFTKRVCNATYFTLVGLVAFSFLWRWMKGSGVH